MSFIIYFFVGIIAAIIGALPLGTTNVAVINITIKQSIQSALKIIYPAACAELILVLIAMNFNMQIEHFISMNSWLQYTIILLLLIVGMILVIGRKECIKDENGECVIIKKRRFQISKQLLGFLLGLINPTVLIYWILVISFLNKKLIYLSTYTGQNLLLLFILGVFLGKVMTLYGYGKFSHMLKTRMTNMTTHINKVIGGLLVCISIFQITKLWYSTI